MGLVLYFSRSQTWEQASLMKCGTTARCSLSSVCHGGAEIAPHRRKRRRREKTRREDEKRRREEKTRREDEKRRREEKTRREDEKRRREEKTRREDEKRRREEKRKRTDVSVQPPSPWQPQRGPRTVLSLHTCTLLVRGLACMKDRQRGVVVFIYI
ncbi:hypothetical protein IWX50DRAFT_407484 [Phyllosticta citricarpa]